MNLTQLLTVMDPDGVVFGSDWPHPEGAATPAAFFDHAGAFSDGTLRLLMRESALRLMAEP